MTDLQRKLKFEEIDRLAKEADDTYKYFKELTAQKNVIMNELLDEFRRVGEKYDEDTPETL